MTKAPLIVVLSVGCAASPPPNVTPSHPPPLPIRSRIHFRAPAVPGWTQARETVSSATGPLLFLSETHDGAIIMDSFPFEPHGPTSFCLDAAGHAMRRWPDINTGFVEELPSGDRAWFYWAGSSRAGQAYAYVPNERPDHFIGISGHWPKALADQAGVDFENLSRYLTVEPSDD